MNDERVAAPGSKDPLRNTRYVLAGTCCGIFIAVLLVLAQMVRVEPLRPLREVGITAILVCAMFALCLVSVAIFARMRGEAERRRGVRQ
jgi:hypothetical protein